MDELLDSDTGYVRVPLVSVYNFANTVWILEVRLHVQDYGKEDLEYGSHSKIKKIFAAPNVVEVLETEFKSHRGRVMVSRKSRPPPPNHQLIL
jgi:hypothetical protein